MPRWYQIAVILRNRILNGRFAAGDRIPSEAELVKEFGVSRMTVRQALDRLANEHLIVRQQGIGTMVSQSIRSKPLALTGYLEDLLILFAQTQVVHADLQEVPTPPNVAKILQTPDKTSTRITRVRESDSQTFSFSQSYLPSSIGRLLSAEELRSNLLFEILESRFGIVLSEAFEIIGCGSAEAAVARYLNLEPGSPVLCIELHYFAEISDKIGADANGAPAPRETRPIAVIYFYIRPDMTYQVRLVRVRDSKKMLHGGLSGVL